MAYYNKETLATADAMRIGRLHTFLPGAEIQDNRPECVILERVWHATLRAYAMTLQMVVGKGSICWCRVEECKYCLHERRGLLY